MSEPTAEPAIDRVAAELARHAAPRFRDEDGGDTGHLNCRCGTRIPPKAPVPYRDWTAHDRHVAEAVLAAIEGSS